MSSLPLVIEAKELQAHLGAPRLLIVDLCKDTVYPQAHIPGAVHVPSRALVLGEQPAPGRLPTLEQLAELFSWLGLTPDTHVVAYDDEGGGWAGRFLWTLEIIGHRQYSYLNGGLHAWLGDRLPVESGENAPQSTPVTLSLDQTALATMDYLKSRVGAADLQVWDARSPEEFRGERLFAQRGGHIPGASNYEWTRAMDRENALRLRPLETIRTELAALGISADKEIVTHCQTHHRSGFTWLVGRILGFPRLKAYAGSWSEWGNHADTPIEK